MRLGFWRSFTVQASTLGRCLAWNPVVDLIHCILRTVCPHFNQLLEQGCANLPSLRSQAVKSDGEIHKLF